MSISNASGTYGLSATGTPTRENTSGTITIGEARTPVNFTDADIAYSVRAVIATGDFVLDLSNAATTGSTVFAAGAAQVESATITAASGATSSGTMTLVLTSAGMAGSPLNVPVALVTGTDTTAALIAAKARAALSAVTVVAERFTVGGTGADIVLTTKGATVGGVTIYSATDSTLNLAIPSGLGVTAAASSANTTAGTATTGVMIYDAGVDFEGKTLVAITAKYGVICSVTGTGNVAITDSAGDELTIRGGEILQRISPLYVPVNTWTIQSVEPVEVNITVIGKS